MMLAFVATALAIVAQDNASLIAQDWYGWLMRLDGFTCAGLNLAEFPSTLLVHGEEDVVVAPEQSREFARTLPHAKLAMWKACGHAPHWHDAAALRQLIAEHTHV